MSSGLKAESMLIFTDNRVFLDSEYKKNWFEEFKKLVKIKLGK
ncbi:hypothetical protein THA_376 [Thermosipho africanus TCF52B]|uniref:Uncharacterized protein n=1 Tax=Thermosipho africanus (strain TCF52B) TaxID=484019 RepID=B7IFK6_THEAB|nr:hypothetical protein THA_376 [Thermosipho africanus TCF52B]